MKILPLHKELVKYLNKHQLNKKFKKQSDLFIQNINHPSLNVEILEPRYLRIYSFRIDKKYRAIFFFHNTDLIEIIDINNHYR